MQSRGVRERERGKKRKGGGGEEYEGEKESMKRRKSEGGRERLKVKREKEKKKKKCARQTFNSSKERRVRIKKNYDRIDFVLTTHIALHTLPLLLVLAHNKQ